MVFPAPSTGSRRTKKDSFFKTFFMLSGIHGRRPQPCPSNVAGRGRLADFAPDANIKVSAVPGPATYGMLMGGLGMLGLLARGRPCNQA
jgi:hypothetical protein